MRQNDAGRFEAATMAKAIAVAEQQNTGLQQWKTQPARLGEFLKDVRAEMRKVITPSRAEVQNTTIVVLATVFIFAAYFWLVDNIIGHGVDLLFKHLATHQ
jgi:preprotein translocase subunit SecE